MLDFFWAVEDRRGGSKGQKVQRPPARQRHRHDPMPGGGEPLHRERGLGGKRPGLGPGKLCPAQILPEKSGEIRDPVVEDREGAASNLNCMLI